MALAGDRNRAGMKGSGVYFIALSPSGRVLSMNRTLLQAVGSRLEPIIGKHLPSRLLPREGRAALAGAMHQLHSRNDSVLAQVPIRAAHGGVLQVEWWTRVVRQDDGKIRQYFAVGIDITERDRQEKLQAARIRILEALIGRGSLQSLQEMLVDQIQGIWPGHPVAILMVDPDQGTLHNTISRGLPDHFTALLEGLAIGPSVGCSGKAAYSGTRAISEDIQNDPDCIPFRELAASAGLKACWSEPILASGGRVLGTFSVYARRTGLPTEEDLKILHEVAALASLLHERKQVEAELALRNAAIQAAANAIAITDRHGVTQWVNGAFSELTGYAPEEVQGQPIRILKSTVQDPAAFQELWDTILAGQVWKGELVNRRKDGSEYIEEQTITPVHGEDGSITHFIAIKQDVSARKTSEAILRKLSEALEQSADAIAILELDGTVVHTNPAFHQVLNLKDSSVIGESIATFLEDPQHPGHLAELLARSREGLASKGRYHIQTAGGVNLTLDGSLSPVRDTDGVISGLVVVFRDVTREIEQGRRLIQSQKMDSLGALAGGVAHDFNNILTAILNCTEMIEWQLEPDSPIHSRLSIIYQVTQRARELNRQILSFSRKSEDRRIPFDLSAVTREAVRLLRSTLPKNIHLQETVTSPIWAVGNPAQAHQVLLNLAINGCQAIGSRPGQLTLSLCERELDEAEGLPLPPGRYAELCIRDSGSGMDPQTLERIFEPFFTTKKDGEGTGLGLSVVHGIVHASGGHIRVESAPGKGSSFWVYLPCAVEAVLEPSPSQETEVFGSERILLVDDEDIVAALAKHGLERLGYQVVAKTSPVDALEEFRAQPGAFDLLVTDLDLPTYSGTELTRRIRLIRPGMPAILVTGTENTLAAMPSLSVTFQETLVKPLVAKDLGAAIRRAMDARRLLGTCESYPEAEIPLDQDGHPRVLLVEDSETTRNLVGTWMAKAGYQVEEARDGQEAWEHFAATQSHAPFSLVLTEILMPRMDGLELVERIRKADPDVPVVILCSMQDAEAGSKAQYLQANEFLVKPFTSEVLLSTLARLARGGMSRTQKEQLEETAQAVRMAHKVMAAVPVQDLPIFSICEPLTAAGGDVFRCYRRPDGTALLVLADVAGHSVLSSYAVASFLGMLTTFIPGSGGLTELFQRLNQNIQTGPFPDVPIAVLAADWDPRTGRLHVVNAGNPCGIWHRKDLGRTEPITLKGTPLGLFSELRVREKVLVLEPGDRILFGTDGLFDTRSPGQVFFRDLVPLQWERTAALPVEQALGAMCEAVKEHGEGRILDDVLVVGLEQPAWAPGPHELVLVLPSLAASVDLADQELDKLLAHHPQGRELSKARRFNLVLALHEALSNAIEHGNGGDPGKRVALACRLTETAVRVQVVDEGPGFDLDTFVPPEAVDAERHRGVAILRAVTRGLRMCGGELEFQFDLMGAGHDLDS